MLTLAGSAAGGPIRADDATQFKAGVATEADVITELGAPLSSSTISDGTSILVYSSLHTKPNVASFLPVVGLFAGGASAKATTIVFMFDAGGVLKSATTNATNIRCSVSLFSASCNH
jgi:hypothetical protein